MRNSSYLIINTLKIYWYIECLLCAGTVLINEQNRQNSSSAHTNASVYLSLFFLSLKWKYNALNWENYLCGGRWREKILEYNAKFETLAGNLTPFCRNVWTSILSDNGGVNAVHHGYKTLKSKISQMIHFKAQCGLKLVKALIIVAELNSGTYENNYIFQISQWVFVSNWIVWQHVLHVGQV